MVGGPCGEFVAVDQDLLLKVLVRAAFALKWPTLVADTELRRWQLIDPLDSRAMLIAGFITVHVDDTGNWHPVWRHQAPRNVPPSRAQAPRHDNTNVAPPAGHANPGVLRQLR